MNTEQLFSEIDRHFLAKLDYIQRFTSSERQIEGWFKGELIYLFTSLQGKGELEGWEPEVLVPRLGKKKVDFRVELDNGFAWLELKSLYHGQLREPRTWGAGRSHLQWPLRDGVLSPAIPLFNEFGDCEGAISKELL